MSRLKLARTALLGLALLAALPSLAAAATPAPLDVGATRVLSAQYFQNYAGKFLVVKARDTGASSLTMSWFDEDSPSAAGSKAMTRRSDAGVYLYDSALVPVTARPDHVVVERDGANYSRAPVTDWATGADPRPIGYLSDFQAGYVTPTAANQRIESLVSQFPDNASLINLPLKSNGYQRRAQTIVGATATGSTAPQEGAAASSAVVLTSKEYGQSGGNAVSVAFHNPGANNSPLSVAVAGNAITVNLATGPAGAITSSAAQVVAAINASPGSAALVTASTYRGNVGGGVVVPTSAPVALNDGLTAPIGQSREPQTVRALRIGKVRDGSKLGVLITAWTNGRDRVTPLVALELAERLLRNYALNPVTKGLVDNLDIFIVPAVNPDGATYAVYDNPEQSKNMTSHCAATGAADPAARNLWGVNIGRNFSVGSIFDGFAGGSSSCTDGAFAGPNELSEPETYNVNWLLSTFPNIKFAADLQASGGSVTWSPGAYKAAGRETLPAPPFGTRQYFAALAGRIATDTARERDTVLLPTEVGTATDVHGSAAGNLLDEAYYDRGIFALGIDVGADRMAADGARTPVGTVPTFSPEGRGEALEFADGIEGLLGAALDYAGDTTPPQVTADPPAGAYGLPLGIRFHADEPARIHYTLDGSTPTLASPEYEPATPLDPVEPIQITATTTVKWIAHDIKGNISAVHSAEYLAAAPAALSADPTALAFGDVAVGQSSASRTVTVHNDGELSAALGTVALSGDSGAVLLSADTCSATTLAAGASCQVSVRLAPTRPGALSATLTVPSDAPGAPPAVAITGTAIAASLPIGPGITPPLTGLRASARCAGPGRDVFVSYTLAAPARVTLTLQRRLTPRGTRPLAVCPKGSGQPGSGSVRYSDRIPFQARPRPLPTRRVSRTVTQAAGAHRIALLKTLRAPRLAPGAYRVVLVVKPSDGSAAQTETVQLRVLRPR